VPAIKAQYRRKRHQIQLKNPQKALGRGGKGLKNNNQIKKVLSQQSRHSIGGKSFKYSLETRKKHLAAEEKE